MEIEFVNHASVVLRYKDISLISDPWIEGYVFHNGWSLLAPTIFKYEDFSRITHIWFSHEHPDHFFPPNLKKIPPDIRKNITVLYQRTHDKKVIRFCNEIGFRNTIELIPGQPLILNEECSILNDRVGHDSWLYFKTPRVGILNLNDCPANSKEEIEKIWRQTGDVDIVLSQFSYAQWEGNKNQPELRRSAADRKLEIMIRQAKVMRSNYVIPFASFIRFAHEENSYMNDGVNSLDKVENEISSKNLVPIIMFPGDRWVPFEERNNHDAILKYSAIRQNSIPAPSLVKSTSVPFESLQKQAESFVKRSKEKIRLWRRILTNPLLVFITDLNETVQLSLRNGLEAIPSHKKEFHIAVSSEVLFYCLEFNWGFNTTHVNGRIEVNGSRGYKEFSKYESLGNMMNHDIREQPLILKVLHKVFSFLLGKQIIQD